MLTRELNSYRITFFEEARRRLAEDGVDFQLFVGGATSSDKAKNDPAELDWAQSLTTREISFRGRDFWWQPAIRLARRSELIITEQASKQLTNIPLSLLQRAGLVRHCLWGHGRNFQRSIEGGAGEGLKRWFTLPAHWFFSYTSLSTDVLVESGFPADRITTFQNSTDVEEVRSLRALQGPGSVDIIREELGLMNGPVVGYIGGLYPAKRVGFLLDALDEIHLLTPDIQAVVIGSGIDEPLVEEFARSRPWVKHMGAVYGPRRVDLAACCELLLMPGLVGLNVVDGFALGLPTVTTAIDYHSPEIAYLRHGENGWICGEDATAHDYAKATAAILRDRELLTKLKGGAQNSADELGIARMAELFSAGVKQALNARPRRWSSRP